MQDDVWRAREKRVLDDGPAPVPPIRCVLSIPVKYPFRKNAKRLFFHFNIQRARGIHFSSSK